MRLTIFVRKESTTDEEAVRIKQLIVKALDKIPDVEVELNTMGR